MVAHLYERNAHPRDEFVKFDGDTHTYFIHGSSEGVTSVTTLIGGFFPEFDADAVIAQYYDRWQKNKRNKYYGKAKEEIKKQWKVVGEEAASEGTKLHAAIEMYYNNDPATCYYTSSLFTYDIERKEWKQFLAFQKKYNLKAYRTEMRLWSEEHKLGGTLDLIVKNSDGSFSIYDWKRAKDKIWKEERHWNRYGSGPLSNLKDNKYFRHSMQLNMYRELIERYYGYQISSMHIVRLHPDAKDFEVVDVERMEKETNAVLRRRLTDIDAESDLTSKLSALTL